MLSKTNCLVAVVTCCVAMAMGASLVKRDVETRKDEEEYLKTFGYMGPSMPDARMASLVQTDPEQAFIEAVKSFQHFAGLNETGIVDDKTRAVMKKRRCGVPDNVNMASIARRRKRYALEGSRWGWRDLTYKITQFTNDLWTTEQKEEIRRAFKVWSDHSDLTFRETTGRPDIEIKFVRGEHGDGNPFDGNGRVLAHAFFPRYGGDAHFDDDEDFTKDTRSGTNLFQVAAHEFGHSLGLGHSSVQSALMAPFYQGYQADFKLDQDDINAIQRLYSAPSNTPTPTRQPSSTAPHTTRPRTNPPASTSRPTTRPTNPPQPDYCRDGSFDVMTMHNGYHYAFRGDKVMKLDTRGVVRGWPKPISQTVFRELPSDLDAAVHWPLSNQGPARTYFFKGNRYWRYENDQLVVNYPRYISQGFRGLPNDIDAAFVWGRNGVTYFIKDGQYFRYSRGRSVDAGYPRPLSVWKGLPSRIDAAFQYTNGRTYFFDGPKYYRFDDQAFQVDQGYPRLNNVWWLGCEASTNDLETPDQDQDQDHDMEQDSDDKDQFFDVMPSSAIDPQASAGQASAHITTSLLLAMLSFSRWFSTALL